MALAACGTETAPTPECSAETVHVSSFEPCLVPIATYDGTSDLVISVDWSPVDDYVLSGANGEVRLLRLTGEPPAFESVTTYTAQGGRAFVSWSPDGELALSSSTDVRLLRVDRAGGTVSEAAPAFAGHVGDVYALAWSPDGTHALSVGEDGTARLLAVDAAAASLLEVARFDTPGNQIYDVAYAPSGTRAAIAVQDGTLRVLAVDVEGGSLTELTRSTLDAWVTAVAWSPRGDEILAGSWRPCGSVELQALDAGDRLRTEAILDHHPRGVRVAHFGPAGAFAVTAGHDDTVDITSLPVSPLASPTVATWADNAHGVHGVSLSRDARRMVVAASHLDRLTLLDASSCPLP